MRQQLADYRVFWREFRNTYRDTGAVLPSGQSLARALARYVSDGGGSAQAGATEGRRILEVGPGTGAVTSAIVAALRPSDRLDLVERNDQFVTRLRARLSGEAAFSDAAHRVRLIHASVQDISENDPYDIIISGLPFNNFAAELVNEIIEKLRRLLASGGTMSFFEYVGVRRAKAVVSRSTERSRLRGVEHVLAKVLGRHEVDRNLVLANIPPAWVHHIRFDEGRTG